MDIEKEKSYLKIKTINKPLIIAIIAVFISLVVITISIGLYLTNN